MNDERWIDEPLVPDPDAANEMGPAAVFIWRRSPTFSSRSLGNLSRGTFWTAVLSYSP